MPIGATPGELAVFYGPDFAKPVTRTRAGVPAVTFNAIVGEADDDVFDGKAYSTHRQMAWAAGPDVKHGDTVTLEGIAHEVLSPRAVNDGAEMRGSIRRKAAAP